MTTPVTLRGRAATPVRPGLVVKAVLMGLTPLVTGELVNEAAITDLHSAYQELIRRENAVRPRAKRLRGMTYPSFLKLFKFAQLLGLVELVREEPMQFPPPAGHLYSVRKPDGPHVMISTRRVFKLTFLGAEDERSWTNLCKAWIEQWPAPARAEYLPPVYVPRPPKVRPPVRVVAEFIPYEWREPLSSETLRALAEHLRLLAPLSIESPGVSDEIRRLTTRLNGWVIEVDEALDDAKAVHYVEEIVRLERILSYLRPAHEALLDLDLLRAAENLEGLVS